MNYSGYNGFAIHFASSKINLYNSINNKKLSLNPEDYYSGKSILKNLNSLGKVNKKNSKKNKYNINQKKYLDKISMSLGSLIGLLINITDPNCLILGGGVIENNLYFSKKIKKNIRKYIFADKCKRMPIINSKLKGDAGLLGAAAIFK